MEKQVNILWISAFSTDLRNLDKSIDVWLVFGSFYSVLNSVIFQGSIRRRFHYSVEWRRMEARKGFSFC
jgi:hypothetical protein